MKEMRVIQLYHSTPHGASIQYYFPVNCHNYSVSAFRYPDSYGNRVVFDVLDQNNYSVDDVTHLLTATEEELFQLSCTVEYDVYLVHACVKSLQYRMSNNLFGNEELSVTY